MTVSLKNIFLANARGFTFEDTASVTWTFNANLNQITAAVAGTPSGANPSVSVGLTAVNGSALTFMRSDGAPALSQAIVPTWAGLHTFGAGLTVSAGTFTLNGHTLTLTANASVSGTNTGDQAIPAGANPSTGVGLAVVNGSALTFMRSDGAPALSQAIAPTWSGIHTFAQGISASGGASAAASTAAFGFFGGNAFLQCFGVDVSTLGGMQIAVYNSTTSTAKNVLTTTQSGLGLTGIAIGNSTDKPPVTNYGPISCNGNSPPAQSTGWGTPTGGTVVNNFAAGATPSLLQLSEAVAQLIVILKQVGILAA